MYLLSPNRKQFKANLHSHSTRSDGALSPEELKDAYRKRGYSILAITDHESPKNHSALNENDFLLLTAYEAYIRPDPECRYDVFSSEIHLNLFAKDPQNESLVCYHPTCCKYLSPDEQALLHKIGSQRTREYTVDYINEFIRTANENGYLVGYNHPVWSMEAEERILRYEGIFSMEMSNGNSDSLNKLEYNGALYNTLLRNGKTWFVHASDDNHNKYPFDHPQNDSFLAFTMIAAKELSYEAVIDAMEHGDMYSSSGPLIHEVSFDGQTLHVASSDAITIICHDGSKHPPAVYASADAPVNTADFIVREEAPFVRITVIDAEGHCADTRGFTKAELQQN